MSKIVPRSSREQFSALALRGNSVLWVMWRKSLLQIAEAEHPGLLSKRSTAFQFRDAGIPFSGILQKIGSLFMESFATRFLPDLIIAMLLAATDFLQRTLRGESKML